MKKAGTFLNPEAKPSEIQKESVLASTFFSDKLNQQKVKPSEDEQHNFFERPKDIFKLKPPEKKLEKVEEKEEKEEKKEEEKPAAQEPKQEEEKILDK